MDIELLVKLDKLPIGRKLFDSYYVGDIKDFKSCIPYYIEFTDSITVDILCNRELFMQACKQFIEKHDAMDIGGEELKNINHEFNLSENVELVLDCY